jgi:hypothetical protein
MTLSSKQWSVSLVSAVALAALIGGLAATNASAQGADTKKVTVKKGPVTITMPAVVNVRAKACVSVPYEYKIEASARAQSLNVFVREKNGQPMAGDNFIFPARAITSLDELDAEDGNQLTGKRSLRFCGQPQRSTLKFGGPWVAASNGKQNAQVTVSSGANAESVVSVPFQLNVIKRK